MDLLKSVITPIHKEGYVFIMIFAGISVVLAVFSSIFGVLGLVATLWCIYFFRDPERVTPDREGLIISPADGVVSAIEQVSAPAELNMGDGKYTRVSIFLNIFNVHVNRVPLSGTITALNYHHGKFLNASLDKASEDNERQTCVVTSGSRSIIFVQIAGLIARRIVCNLHENQQVKTGERFGIIRFGSRCDVYLPEGVNPMVAIGQTMIGGESIIADLHSNEPARAGVKS